MGSTTHSKGFTVVELLIVIVVIGILAGIVMVMYPGYQQRARDSQRKSDLQQIAAALGTYAIQKGNFVGSGSGCGASGNGNGWFSATGSANGNTYPASIASCLQGAGILTGGSFVDPSGCTFGSGGACGAAGSVVKAYMKATCTKNGQPVTYVLAHIEGENRRDSEINALCDTGTVAGFTSVTQQWGTNFGMNYYVTVK